MRMAEGERGGVNSGMGIGRGMPRTHDAGIGKLR